MSEAGDRFAEPAAPEGAVPDDVAALATLGDDTRYRLVRLLAAADGELPVGKLASLVDVGDSAVSHALADLRKAGLATRRRAGRRRYYDATRRSERLVAALDATREGADEEGARTTLDGASRTTDEEGARTTPLDGTDGTTDEEGTRTTPLDGTDGTTEVDPGADDAPTTVAFVCVRNAGRSQMARAFAERERDRRDAGDRVALLTGGTRTADEVHDVVVEAMAERGVDVGDRTTRAVTPDELRDADIVVTMGCSAGDVCPATWGGDSRDWGLDDPHGRPLGEVREIRDEVEERVGALFDEVVGEDTDNGEES